MQKWVLWAFKFDFNQDFHDFLEMAIISIIFIIFRLLNEDLVSEVPVNTSYHEHNRSRRSRRNQGAGSSSGKFFQNFKIFINLKKNLKLIFSKNIFFSWFQKFSGHNRGDDNDERFQEITAQANIEVKYKRF